MVINSTKKKNEIIEKENLKIEDVIYELDGREIMLDSDLAKLYNVKQRE